VTIAQLAVSFVIGAVIGLCVATDAFYSMVWQERGVGVGQARDASDFALVRSRLRDVRAWVFPLLIILGGAIGLIFQFCVIRVAAVVGTLG
jgi:hypothetical protein